MIAHLLEEEVIWQRKIKFYQKFYFFVLLSFQCGSFLGFLLLLILVLLVLMTTNNRLNSEYGHNSKVLIWMPCIKPMQYFSTKVMKKRYCLIYVIRIRMKGGIYSQIYLFAWRSSWGPSPHKLLKAKGYIWPYIPSRVLFC